MADLIKMWWPHPSSIMDLSAEETEEGLCLSAPEGTECAEWLSYFSQSKEYHSFFEEKFLSTLMNYCEYLEKNGKG